MAVMQRAMCSFTLAQTIINKCANLLNCIEQCNKVTAVGRELKMGGGACHRFGRPINGRNEIQKRVSDLIKIQL
jgi:hypothetical protein